MNRVSSAGSSSPNSAVVQRSRIWPAVASMRSSGTSRPGSRRCFGSTTRWVTASATGSTITRVTSPQAPSLQLASAPIVNCAVPAMVFLFLFVLSGADGMPGAPAALAAAIGAGLVVVVAPDFLPVGAVAAVVIHRVAGIGAGVERGRFRRGAGIRRRAVRGRGRAGLRGALVFRGVEDLVGGELDAVGDQEPDDRVSPHEQGPVPAQARHQDPG